MSLWLGLYLWVDGWVGHDDDDESGEEEEGRCMRTCSTPRPHSFQRGAAEGHGGRGVVGVGGGTRGAATRPWSTTCGVSSRRRLVASDAVFGHGPNRVAFSAGLASLTSPCSLLASSFCFVLCCCRTSSRRIHTFIWVVVLYSSCLPVIPFILPVGPPTHAVRARCSGPGFVAGAVLGPPRPPGHGPRPAR